MQNHLEIVLHDHTLLHTFYYAACVDKRFYLLLFIEDSDSEEETDKVNKCSLVWEVGNVTYMM